MQDSKEIKSNHLRMINDMSYKNRYSSMSGNLSTLSDSLNRPRRLNKLTLRKALENPLDNVNTLQQASMLLKSNNGIYKRLLNYQSTMLTNDHMIIPKQTNKLNSFEDSLKSYLGAATNLESYNLKNNAAWIIERVLEQGELYVYKIESKNNVTLQEIPNTLCKITHISDGVNRWSINLSSLNDKLATSMPIEIQNVYKRFKTNKLDRKKLIEGVWYTPLKNNYAFNMDRYCDKGIPFYCTIFDDLMSLEDMKDLKNGNAELDNVKLIHNLIPTDNDTGDVLMDFDVIHGYHSAIKESLPRGIVPVTTPMKMSSVNMGDSNTRISNSVKQNLENAYDSAGVSVELFNGTKASNEGIVNGIITDSLVPKRIQAMIEDWINYDLNTKKNNIWKVKFMDSTHYDKSQLAQKSREATTTGFSKLKALALEGFTPLESINILLLEDSMALCQLLVPVQSSHTTSNKGRPSKENAGGEGNTTQPINE